MSTELTAEQRQKIFKAKSTRRLNKQDKRDVKRLFKEGMSRIDIAYQLGLAYSQVQHVLEHKRVMPIREGGTKEPTWVVPENGSDWKEKYETLKKEYSKAVMMLIEHDLLEVSMG